MERVPRGEGVEQGRDRGGAEGAGPELDGDEAGLTVGAVDEAVEHHPELIGAVRGVGEAAAEPETVKRATRRGAVGVDAAARVDHGVAAGAAGLVALGDGHHGAADGASVAVALGGGAAPEEPRDAHEAHGVTAQRKPLTGYAPVGSW